MTFLSMFNNPRQSGIFSFEDCVGCVVSSYNVLMNHQTNSSGHCWELAGCTPVSMERVYMRDTRKELQSTESCSKLQYFIYLFKDLV